MNYDKESLEGKNLIPDLREIAKQLGIKRVEKFNKQDLVYEILEEQAKQGASSVVNSEAEAQPQTKKRGRPKKNREAQQEQQGQQPSEKQNRRRKQKDNAANADLENKADAPENAPADEENIPATAPDFASDFTIGTASDNVSAEQNDQPENIEPADGNTPEQAQQPEQPVKKKIKLTVKKKVAVDPAAQPQQQQQQATSKRKRRKQ
ncbi:MAG: Rho termination factor N-terminal domain-containing protein, partial [Bacteroidales bacterium]|nr:Rho termination factor N-terminal domain-containing protein [Bacteroidales bacterium]